MPEVPGKAVVSIPSSQNDAPPWLRVGVLAAVGLVVGIVWPRLVGVKLGPNPPSESAAGSAAAGQAPPDSPMVPRAPASGATVASAATPAGPPSSGAAGVITAAPAAKAMVTVPRGYAVSCKSADAESKKGKACDTRGFDTFAMAKLGTLATCEGAAEAIGKLSVVLSADFKRSRIGVDIGKSSTVKPNDALVQCVKQLFSTNDLASIDHADERYVVAYGMTFAPAPSAPGDTANAGTPAAAVVAAVVAAGTTVSDSEVVWEVALVRESPKTGPILTRLHRGTKVKVLGEPQESWYRIRFGETGKDPGQEGRKDGWVYRGALGK